MEHCLATFKRYTEEFSTDYTVFAETPASRKTIALATLQEAFPGADFLEDRILRPEPHSAMRVSMLDLYISGELVRGDWDWNKDRHILDEYPQLNRLPDNQQVFEAGVVAHHAKLHRALAANIKLAMSQMPRADRDIFQKNKVSVYTIRESVAKKVAPTGSGAGGLIGVDPDKPQYRETQADRDQAVGRFAVILFVDLGNDQYVCYEMFNLLGSCRINVELGRWIAGSELRDMRSRLEFTGRMNDLLPPAVTINVPVDLQSYIHGTEPKPNAFAKVAIEKLGDIPAPLSPEAEHYSVYRFVNDAHVANIAKFIVGNRPLATPAEFILIFTDLTEHEQKSKDYHEVVDFIIDLIVPFKACIENLASGERDRIVDGVFGCTMDAIGLVFTVLGASTKVLQIAAKSISLSAKASKLVSFGVTTAVSVFNPIDGIPELGYRMSKVALRNTFRLSEKGSRLIANGTFKVRKLMGRAHSVDFLSMASTPRLGQGSSRLGGGVPLDVLAANRRRKWYAINRRGLPWGKPLPGFDLKQMVSVSGLRNPLPASFTKNILQEGLLKASKKVNNAMSVLQSPAMNLKTDPVIGLFLGSTPAGRDNLMTVLNTIKVDMDGTSLSNFILDEFKINEEEVSFDPSLYERWKDSVSVDREGIEFIAVNVRNMNFRFMISGFDHGEIADDLIHEFISARSKKYNPVLALGVLENQKEIDVAPLLNLAGGRLAYPVSDGGVAYHDRSLALDNPDSLALTIALLSQLKTNEPEFSRNIKKLTASVEAIATQPVAGAVVLSTNR